jgi:nucleoid DNA-binding protein
LNKIELVEAIAKTELSKVSAGRALEAVLGTIVRTVAMKQDVQLIGFGTFKEIKRSSC